MREALALLTEGLVERTVEAKLLLLAALGGEHLLFIGPPGTAKSLLARRLAEVCDGQYYERLLTRFTVPEEVFGPLSLKALEQDELRRKVQGFLPEATVAFLDEIFKANSSILNSLLTILNERMFQNGGAPRPVPLLCTVAASNELPESDELVALYDRFLLRRAVASVKDVRTVQFLHLALGSERACGAAGGDGSRAKFGSSSHRGTRDRRIVCAGQGLFSVADAKDLRLNAERVAFPDRVLALVLQLRAHLRDEVEPPIQISDRRLARAVRLLRVAACAAGAKEVSEIDLLLLQHMFWDRDPASAGCVREWILDNALRRPGGSGDIGDVHVEGAGKALLDGVYTRSAGEHSGRPLYVQRGGPGVMYFESGCWRLHDHVRLTGAGDEAWYWSAGPSRPSAPPTCGWLAAQAAAGPAPTLWWFADGSGGGDQSVLRARALVEAARGRVRGASSAAELERARQDLLELESDLRALLTSRARVRMRIAAALEGATRAFWLEDADVDDFAGRLMASGGEVDDIEALLSQVWELQVSQP